MQFHNRIFNRHSEKGLTFWKQVNSTALSFLLSILKRHFRFQLIFMIFRSKHCNIVRDSVTSITINIFAVSSLRTETSRKKKEHEIKFNVTSKNHSDASRKNFYSEIVTAWIFDGRPFRNWPLAFCMNEGRVLVPRATLLPAT